MKTLSADLAADYASPSATITTCWKITRRDFKRFYYTALDRDLVVQGNVYRAIVGVAGTAIASSADLSIQNLTVNGLLNAGLVAIGAMTEADILAGVWDGARVTVFETNWMDPARGTVTLQTGRLGEISTGRLSFAAEVRGLMQNLSQTIGHAVLPGCFKDVGDANCGVNLALYTYTGTVTRAINTLRWVDTTLSQPDHFFRYGKVSWLTGANATLSMEVKDQAAAGDIILQSDMPYPIAAGDTYRISAGCNKLLKRESQAYAAAIAGSVTSLGGSGDFSDSARSETDHTFDGGRFTWLTGDNVGIVTEVANFIGSAYHLLGTSPFAIQVGDTYTIEEQINTGVLVYDGDCKTKFVLENPDGNGDNHGGFAEVPGNDKVLGAGNQ